MKETIKRNDMPREYYFDEGCFIIEYSNSNDDPELSIARARVEPGVTTKWHALDGVVERYVIIDGVGRVEIGDLEPQQVTAGDVVIIPSGIRQRISNCGDSSLVFLAICTPRFKQSAYIAL